MKREIRGSGWEKREITIPETVEEHLEFLESVMEKNRQAAEGKDSFFGAVTHDVRRVCKNTIEKHGEPPFANRTPADYAMRTQQLLGAADQAIADGDASHAAHMAWKAAREFTFVELKLAWEEHALRGRKSHEDNSTGGKNNDIEHHASKRERVLREISRLVNDGHTLARACYLAADNGFGPSQAANLKRVKRHGLR